MILNNDQLKDRAHEFALTHELCTNNKVNKGFWPVFKSDMDSLHEFAEQLRSNNLNCKQPAEDWLLDHINFIETQAQVVMRELSRTMLKQLPRLQSTGMPRIYAICSDYLEHVDGHYDVKSFENYLLSYQEVAVLKVAECWALPSAMRVMIIRRLAVEMREVRHRHEVCNFITSLLGSISIKSMSDIRIRSLLERATRKKKLGPVEVVHFVQHLREWEPNIQTVRDWLAAHVGNSESSLEQMVSFEHQLQTELQVNCGNLVRSLHLLERLPWQLTFTKISHVEQILLSDTTSEYKCLDIQSCDLLRGRIAEFARQLDVPEVLVAQTAVRLAKSKQEEANQTDLQPRNACLAYYLLDPKGIMDIREEISSITRPRRLPNISLRRQPLLVYLSGTILLFVGLMVFAARWVSYGEPIRFISWLAILVALSLPVSEWVITILHDVICRYCRPTTLLRYDFSEKLPNDASTMVVMPIIWSSIEEVDDVIDRLLIHYLANRQQNIYFGILADFSDASTEIHPEDKKIVDHAIGRIDVLRKQYGDNKFFLFHRSRLYNSVDNIYMGWERKRGKLVEFVELLSGSDQTSYTTIYGQTDILQKIRYIFTADHDTQLPMGVVNRLAGTIHFPYNRPRLNKEETRIVEGFGVLQPRIAVNFESTQRSRFAELWAGDPGIDPYAFAVSNAYQDLFDQAIFVGKGIFEVNAFRKTLINRVPDQHVLSHDLLEGGFLRTGLTSDIEVVESYPPTFYAYEQRAHRWIRGDWQLLKWLGVICKDRHGENKRVALCGLTRWQIIDNLRRSLLTPALLLIAILGLFLLPGQKWVWETIVLLTIFLPSLRALVLGVLGRNISRILGVSFLQSLVQLITLPFSAVLAVDAIIRTLYRLFISKRNLLEWTTSAVTDRRSIKGRVFMYEPAGYIVIFLFSAIAWFSDSTSGRIISVIALVMWLLARPVIQQLNHPRKMDPRTWLKGARPELEELALQIWSFYKKYVTAEESWLPPDNVQYHPKEVVAHRTSPTNIGLYLASVVAARDLKFIDTLTMIKRIEASVKTIANMEKWNGHLLNWYDTQTAKPLFPKYVSTVDSGNFVAYLMLVRQALSEWSQREMDFQSRIENLNRDIEELIEQTNFKSLYNSDERLFCLGYHVDTNQKDTTLYDLLASEARQASFVAIALGQVPISHWFALGRTMTISGKNKTLLSWSGTMFEYMMPSLIMRTYKNTVWDSTYRGVIHQQQTYANKHQVPFGISESGYYAFDYQLNYQYRAFGVPGLGLDRGLEQNLVVAPYATVMALPFSGQAGLAALDKFKDYSAKGEFGFYEAVDFTTARLPRGQRYKVVQSYMAHHQGMSMLTLINLLADDIMIKRFHADARVCAADLILQERVPKNAALIEEPIGLHEEFSEIDGQLNDEDRTFIEPTVVPEINVLSNGSMTSMNTNDGTGMLKWNGLAVTRWREDSVVDTSGAIVYIHDTKSEETWSANGFPRQGTQDTKAGFRLDKTTFEGTYSNISSKLELTISPDVDAEVKRLHIINNSDEERMLEVTSFLELALASPSADSAHPAFSKLFIETSHDQNNQCLLAKRRKREDEEKETWAAHTIYVDGDETEDYEFETDRAEFIKRGYSLESPNGIYTRLRGSVGSVVDPAFIMRRRIQLAPGESAKVYIITGIAENCENVLDIIHRLRESKQADRTFHLAWVRSQIDLRHMHLTPMQASVAQLLAGRGLFAPPLTQERGVAIVQNTLGQSSLWSHGISGDVPVVVVSISNLADLPFVILLARQHQYLCKLGLEIDLVVLDETIGGYQDQLMNRLRDNLSALGIGEMKRIVGLKASQLKEAERTLLITVSRVLLRAGGPSLRAQLQFDEGEIWPLQQEAISSRKIRQKQQPSTFCKEGEFFNGWGGFVEEGKAYEINVQDGRYLPKPWSNVIANPQFGCIFTELGTGYSWWRNSRECKLTPWTNDPVLDQPGECLYLHDLDTSCVWSATPKPAGREHKYKVTHGRGFSRFEQLDGDVVHTMEATVPLKDPLKLIQLRLRNRSKNIKRISITYYAEWVLGVMREAQAPYIVTEWDKNHNTLLARNAYQETFRDAVGFMHIVLPDSLAGKSEQLFSWTGDRREFIGRGGTLEYPSAFLEGRLSNRTGTFSNTCGALQTIIELPAEDEITVTFLIGCTSSKEEVYSLIRQYGHTSAYKDTITSVAQYWEHNLGQVQIKTPDRAMDLMMNGWLLYQTLACRLWARTAFYQAGGAYGFRDQLQDSLAFLHAEPSITKKQILINAAHQYQEGDVQHWWHEETHKGIRTKFSDDLLWLPYTVSRYIEQTGDYEILKEEVPFLYSEVLKEEELERYEDTVLSDEKDSLLEHCLRAIRHALKFGEHGIPLMGIGDWNDGMSRVGAKGKGESVWLGWFLLDILKRFTKFENDIIPHDTVKQFEHITLELQNHLNDSAWDGAWYRRAYTDAGTWLGSIKNKECRIDAIAQSWAVISQGANEERQSRAMLSFDRELVDKDMKLARLLTKAFDKTSPSPGYIQGYPPGIRENGGQYTHGVIWGIVAWAMLGRRDKAFELFSMLNPINHTQTSRDVQIYANEPYVMSADVYTANPHEGRGGWSWYTGAGGWMYQAGLEYVLGIKLLGDQLYIHPCVPSEWESFTIDYRYKKTTYSIEVYCRPDYGALLTWVVDGKVLENQPYLKLVDDGKVHQVVVHISMHRSSTVG